MKKDCILISVWLVVALALLVAQFTHYSTPILYVSLLHILTGMRLYRKTQYRHG